MTPSDYGLLEVESDIAERSWEQAARIHGVVESRRPSQETQADQ